MSDISVILAELRESDRDEVVERLLPLVYDELRALARAHLRHERPDHSLQATALVHEAYLRLLGDARPPGTIAVTSSAPLPRRCVASSSSTPANGAASSAAANAFE
jgi:ECF sigma factor